MGWGNESWFKRPGHMTKMATMPIYGKNLIKSSSPELPRGYIHVLNHEKNRIKSDFKDIFFKLATNE